MEGNCPQPVPLGLLHFSGLQELFRRSLASYGWSELPSGQLLPTQHRWPGCCSHLGQLLGWWWLWQPPHLLQFLHQCPPPLYLTWGWRVLHISHWRSCQHLGFHVCFHRCGMHPHPSLYLQGLLALPHPGHLLGSCHIGKESQPIRIQSSLMRVMWHVWIGECIFFENFHTICSCLLATVSEEWSKYVTILEREDMELRRVMQEE